MNTKALNILNLIILLMSFGCGAAPIPDPVGDSNCPKNTDCTNISWETDENGDYEVKPTPADEGPPALDPSDIEPNPFDEIPDDSGSGGNVGTIGGPTSGGETLPPPTTPTQGGGGGGGDPSGLEKALSDGIKNLAEGIKGLGGLISGESQKKMREARRKKREIEAKIRGATSLANQVKEYEASISNLANDLKNKGQSITENGNHGEKSTTEKVNQAGESHNETINEVDKSLPEFNPNPPTESDDAPEDERDDCYLKLKACTDLTPEDEKVIATREYIEYARDRTKSYQGDRKKGADTMLDAADATSDLAEEAYNEGDLDEGDAYTGVALGLADAAIGFVPGLGWAHDVYQAIAGENLVTGEKVEGFDRTMAVMGALSGGVFSKFNHIVKGSKVLRKIGKADNLVKNGDDYNDAVRKAGDWTKSGIDKDTTDSILKGAGDCLVDSSWSRPSNVIHSILGLIEDTAYASGKKPCEQVVDEVVESAKNSGFTKSDDVAQLAKGWNDVTPDLETKILTGGVNPSDPRKLTGVHSPRIVDDSRFTIVDTVSRNADGTTTVRVKKDLGDGVVSKNKKTTLYPDNWTDEKIANSVRYTSASDPIAKRARDGATYHRQVVDGVEVAVVKEGGNVTSGFPTGTKGFILEGFDPL
ncbi:EndoU domain-containing protein [Pseudobacteriovorax antillogorgiicola]|uniref:Pre-toxin TG n=1 Tax=Pseudobacteriovorax antillogorgiicola TaxID=1513793 RepID=A0A1Y6BXN2_9BACT|nr:EndoU domain-containing protein [Pseudobacteriovorax antillogorgiicola]TCS52290.1 putative toxin of predicted polymorphic toxin system [Pseudobacteriovorax antillogorgiicola]SMF30550.1 Pre-toxin TG [Pseudobacteriovorax antillogorgiicola]